MAPKPLVFVPGLPGTKLFDKASDDELFPNLFGLLSPQRDLLLGRLQGPDDPDRDDGVEARDPIDHLIPLLPFVDLSGVFKQAASLYGILGDLGYTGAAFGDRFRPVGWDWRRPVDHPDTLARVKGAIAELHAGLGEKVTVLCHSTGGLVVQSLFAAEPALAGLVERIFAIGIPWAGTLDPLPLLAEQSGWGPLTARQTRRTLDHSWAAFDLLPPDPAKTDMSDVDLFRDAAGLPSSPLIDTSWIPADDHLQAAKDRAKSADARLGARGRTLDLGDVEIVNVVGWGVNTPTRASLDGAGRVGLQSTPEGDGTIPLRSAAWIEGPRVSTFLVPIGHYEKRQISDRHIVLWENQPVRDLLATVLAGRPRPPYTYAAVDADDAVAVDRARVRVYLVALDEKGAPLPGAYARALQMNPPDPAHYLMREDGLGTMPLRRENIAQGMHDTFHFQVQFHWQEGVAERTSPPQTMWIKK
jgi:hypothetical protein